MKYADKRAEGLALIRQWAREQPAGRTLQTDVALKKAMRALIEEFRMEFDVPGIRYFEIQFHDDAHNRDYVTRRGTESNPHDIPGKTSVSMLKRHEFLSRQGVWRSYEQDRL